MVFKHLRKFINAVFVIEIDLNHVVDVELMKVFSKDDMINE